MGGQEPIFAVGRLAPRGPLIAVRRTAAGYEVEWTGPGESAPRSRRSADRRVLLAAALAFVEDLLASPPAELEATHRDLADLVRWLAASEQVPEIADLLRRALDAIDDGLDPDTVSSRLGEALRATSRLGAGQDDRDAIEQAEVLDLLARDYRSGEA